MELEEESGVTSPHCCHSVQGTQSSRDGSPKTQQAAGEERLAPDLCSFSGPFEKKGSFICLRFFWRGRPVTRCLYLQIIQQAKPLPDPRRTCDTSQGRGRGLGLAISNHGRGRRKSSFACYWPMQMWTLFADLFFFDWWIIFIQIVYDLFKYIETEEMFFLIKMAILVNAGLKQTNRKSHGVSCQSFEWID